MIHNDSTEWLCSDRVNEDKIKSEQEAKPNTITMSFPKHDSMSCDLFRFVHHLNSRHSITVLQFLQGRGKSDSVLARDRRVPDKFEAF